MIINTNLLLKEKIFNVPLKGIKENIKYINLKNNSYIYFENNEDNIESFFMSRIYNYIGINTFKTIILEDKKNNIKILIENLFDNKNNFQLDSINLPKIIDIFFFYQLTSTELIKKQIILSLFGRDDSLVNTIFNYNGSLEYIDLMQFQYIEKFPSKYNIIQYFDEHIEAFF